jgi:hypothetical protein
MFATLVLAMTNSAPPFAAMSTRAATTSAVAVADEVGDYPEGDLHCAELVGRAEKPRAADNQSGIPKFDLIVAEWPNGYAVFVFEDE